MIRAVLFDIGGVLEVNPRTGWQDTWAARIGITRAEFDARLKPIWRRGEIGTASLHDVERATGEAFALDGGVVRALMDDAWAEYLGTLNRELAAYFEGLRPGFRTGMLSNSFVGAREREQEAYGLEDMCDVIVYSHEVGCMKPDRRIYLVACERLAVRAEEAVLLDDVEENVEGARGVGMRAVRFGDNAQAIGELNAVLG